MAVLTIIAIAIAAFCLGSKIEDVGTMLRHTLYRLETRLMALVDDLNAKVDALAGSLQAIRQDITDIKNSIPASGGLTEAEAQALSARLDAVVADAAQLDSENPTV